jgi:hypothetical protein
MGSQVIGQTPNLPKSSDTPNGQRLLAGLDEFIRTVLRTGIFCARAEVSRKVQTRENDEIVTLKWGAFNRVEVNAAEARCQLPFISPQWIGQPLYVAKTNGGGTNTATFVPTGLAVDKRAALLVNNAATFSVSEVGLYVLMTDGQNWFCTGEP